MPGVLVLHDWFGVVDHVKVRAQMLARLGYVALAGDVYGQGVRPSPEEAAGGVFFLCSPWSNFVHGQVLNITGGQFTGMTT